MGNSNQFNVHVSLLNDSTALTSASFVLNMTECPSGFGIDNNTQQCAVCDKGFFSFYDNIHGCYACDDIDGITCPGKKQVIIDVDYWFQLSADDVVLSSDCPTGYCCQNRNGCTYIGNNTDSSLCG